MRDGLYDHIVVLVTHDEFVDARRRGDYAMKYRRIEDRVRRMIDAEEAPGSFGDCFNCGREFTGGVLPAAYVVSMPLPHADGAWMVWCACAVCTETADLWSAGVDLLMMVQGLGYLIPPEADHG
jgi:hypothetical protein